MFLKYTNIYCQNVEEKVADITLQQQAPFPKETVSQLSGAWWIHLSSNSTFQSLLAILVDIKKSREVSYYFEEIDI